MFCSRGKKSRIAKVLGKLKRRPVLEFTDSNMPVYCLFERGKLHSFSCRYIPCLILSNSLLFSVVITQLPRIQMESPSEESRIYVLYTDFKHFSFTFGCCFSLLQDMRYVPNAEETQPCNKCPHYPQDIEKSLNFLCTCVSSSEIQWYLQVLYFFQLSRSSARNRLKQGNNKTNTE